MENDNIEIIDYLRIIWKRKLLIIAGVVVSMVAGLLMVQREQDLYRAEILLSVGGKIVVAPSASSFSLVPFDTSATLVNLIHAKYLPDEEEFNKYSLKAEAVSGTTMIRITIVGAGRKAGEYLNEVSKRFCDDHSRMTEDSIQPLRAAIEQQKVYQREILEEVAGLEIKLKEYETGNIDSVAVIMAQNGLWERKSSLRDIKSELMFYQAFVKNVGECRTKMIGSMNITTTHPNKRSNVIKAGGLGLVISILLAFFIEYIGRTKKIEREKKGDTVLG